jgi:nucleotide-binding universal stress UspA family protein
MKIDNNKSVKVILHPTDFSPDSDRALAHALRLAISNQAELRIFHVADELSDDELEEDWNKFPSVREILHQWGMVAKNASRADVLALGVQVEKVIGRGKSVSEAIERYCALNPIEMIVLSTAGRDGIAAWLNPSTSEQIASKVAPMMIPVLFVPSNCKGCVSMESGEVHMENVLIPVDHKPSSETAVESGLRALSAYGSSQSQLTLLHVGKGSSFPKVSISERDWNVQRIVREGNPVAEILAAADDCSAGLLIMVTAGSHGWLDAIRGTTTEQVIREAKCPVLAIPCFA